MARILAIRGRGSIFGATQAWLKSNGEVLEFASMAQAEAEALAVERLCEAWGHTYGPDVSLDDLGDSAVVTEYSADDYLRDAAPAMLAALQFIAKYSSAWGECVAAALDAITLATIGTPTAQPAAPIPAAPALGRFVLQDYRTLANLLRELQEERALASLSPVDRELIESKLYYLAAHDPEAAAGGETAQAVRERQAYAMGEG